MLALLLAIVSDTAFAACSALRSPQKVWFNEYFFGSGPPNFLEIYSTSNSFPTQWSGMSVEVYSGANTKTTYPLNNTTATACTVANKTWLTHNAVGGLEKGKALVILRDSLGDAVDAYVFDNSSPNNPSPPAPWAGAANNWAPSNTTGCTALDTALTTQAGLSTSTPKQANMLLLPNYGNKDMARTPDGGTPWDLTSNTGAGTTYTQCVSNNANFIKTVDNSTPSPGTTVTFTLSLANTGSSALTGVTVDDFLPDYLVTGAPTFISAIPVNALDTVTQTTYAATDPNTPTAGNATKIQWAPASIAAGTTAKLNIKMQVPANATQGYFYTNTAQTTGSALPFNQTDFASITVGSPNVGSFVFSVTPASASTCSTALLSPKVTVTAMTGSNGTGSVDTAYAGNSVYLSASTANPKWYNSAGTLLATVSPAPAGSFVNGVATFYLKDATAETVTVSGLDTATYTPNVMQGASGNITFTSGNAGLVLIDGETLTPASAYSLSNPAYGVVEGRAHKVRATISSCGATDTSRTGNYSGTIGYTAGLNHPAGATAPTISTTATCPGLAVGAVTLPFVSGISDFYLCTSDVGQFTLNLSLTSPSVAGNTSNFTVRPFAITARDFAAGATANPQGAGAFTGAGYSFSGTFDAWGWRSTEDTNSDGVPDSGVLTSVFSAATHGQPLRFSGTTNAAGVINFGSKSPATGVLAPTTATATAGTVTLSNLTYSEVGVVTFAGTDVAGLYGATNYLGLSGLHVPLISDVVGHFTATTIATGSDPTVNTIAPGSSATDVNLFTLQTNSGTETITSVTVNLSSISGVGRLAITDNAGAELGFTTSPVSGSNTITVSGMTATSTLATFKVRVTPLSHAAMPLPTGGSYDITAPVTAWVGTNPHRGSDTNTNALTIDNLSPGGATATGGSVGNAKVTLNWTTSAAADFSTASGSVVYRWAEGAAGTEVPVEGSTPVVGSTNGTATVACVVSSAAASTAVAGKIDGTGGSADCTTAALTNGTTYTYKVFQKDVNGNYDVGAGAPMVTKSFNPSTIAVNATSILTITITNLDTMAISGLAFTDIYPVNLQNATTPALSNTCGGTATGTAGASVLSLSGGTLAASSSCSVSITVNVGAAGTYENSTVVTWTNGGNGTTVSATLMTAVASPDHYELSLPTSGISCLPSTATVTACADTSSPCTNKYTDANGKTATLATNGGTLSSATVIFDATGVASTTLSYPAAVNGAVVSVTLSGEQAVASNSRQCCPDGTSCAVANSCSTAFSTGGFIFAASSGGVAATIPTQEAGTDSNTYSDTYLRAVKTNTATMACQAALTGAQTVNFGYECNNPTTCSSGNLMSVNGSPVAANNNGSAVSYSAVSTVFDANGNAPLIFNYSDVGLVTLHASKAAGGTLLSTLLGSSNAFVVKPAEFKLSDIKQTASPNLLNLGAVNASGAKFVKAGEAFSVTVTATTSGGTATLNYGQEATAESVKLTSALVTGLGLTTNPAVTYTSGFGAFSNGSATGTDFAWNEVGIITLTPSVADADYLGVGDVTGTNSGNVGRFIPDHFLLTTPTPTPACGTFSYFGQDGFTTAFTLSAVNASGTQTNNYAGDWAKLPLTAWGAAPASTSSPGYGFAASAWLPAQPAGAALAASAIQPTTTPTSITLIPIDTWVSGSAYITAKHQITRSASPAVPTTVNVTALPVDSDGVTMAAAATLVTATPLRYGRLFLQNAYGSELLDLAIPVTAQYWNGSSFVTNDLDSCTSLADGNIGFGNYQSSLDVNNIGARTFRTADPSTGSCDASSAASGNMVTGKSCILFGKPTGAATGSVDLLINLGNTGGNCLSPPLTSGSSAAKTYLSGDWCGGSSYLYDPTARATFGIYKGNSKFIYIRELY